MEMPENDSKGQKCTPMFLSAQCLLFPGASNSVDACTADLCLIGR
jgi:hypothetical protein